MFPSKAAKCWNHLQKPPMDDSEACMPSHCAQPDNSLKVILYHDNRQNQMFVRT